jgi:hypothetical protein
MKSVGMSLALCMVAIGGAIGWRLSQDERTVLALTVWAGTLVTVVASLITFAFAFRIVNGGPRRAAARYDDGPPPVHALPVAPVSGFTVSGSLPAQPRYEQLGSTTTASYD